VRKQNRYTTQLLHRKRERKRLKRLRKNHVYLGVSSVYLKEKYFRKFVDRQIALNFKFPLFDYFIEQKFITGKETISELIPIPTGFSFCKDYDVTISTIKNFTASIFKNVGKDITIDFSKCSYVDYTALFVLQILRLEFQEELNKLDKRMSVLSGKGQFKVTNSPHQEVNKMLLMAGLISQADLKIEGLLPIDTIGFLKGSKSQKHYSENKKGIIATKIVHYINNCLGHHAYTLQPEGINEFGGLISEILNNAEDHSPFNSYYASANFLREPQKNADENVVGEINLTFMNFGYSIYDGIEASKFENEEIYSQLEQIYNKASKSKIFVPFTKADFFTLYSLQGGVSRLKYLDESRGSGTARFITSFFSFGDYEDDIKHYHPSLSLVSGSTQLICDNRFKPTMKDGVFVLSLNADNDLLKPPEKSNLASLKYGFPGTLFTVKIYLNKEHISNKINANDNIRN
jgi:hypothetical protein